MPVLRLAIVMVLLSISAAPAFAGDVITIGGSGSALAVMKMLGKEYEKKNPSVHIRVLPSMGTQGAIKAVAEDKLSIGIAGRVFNGDEKKTGVAAFELARTPFVFVTQSAVKTRNITSDDLVNIYNAKMTTWPGGEQIRLVLRPARETSSLIMKAISPHMEQAMAVALAREGMLFAATDQETADLVMKTPGSLGASTLLQITTEKLSMNILDLNDVRPTVRALAQGKYPLFKPMYIVTSPKTTDAAKGFVRFLQSSQAKSILEKNGCWTGPF